MHVIVGMELDLIMEELLQMQAEHVQMRITTETRRIMPIQPARPATVRPQQRLIPQADAATVIYTGKVIWRGSTPITAATSQP